MSQPFILFRLQQTDTHLDRARSRLQAIEAALSQDETLRSARERASLVEQELEKARKDLSQAEEQVKDQLLKIEGTESTLYSGRVRNPKELQDMQKEAAALKRYRSVLEDRQLEKMIVVEDAEAAYEAALAELEKAQAEVTLKNAGLLKEQAGLLQEVAHAESERQVTAGSLPLEDLRIYEQLRQQRRGIAVAKVENRACSACGTTLNAVLLHAARSSTSLTRCDHCGRILYLG